MQAVEGRKWWITNLSSSEIRSRAAVMIEFYEIVLFCNSSSGMTKGLGPLYQDLDTPVRLLIACYPHPHLTVVYYGGDKLHGS